MKTTIIFDLSEVLLRGLYGAHSVIGKRLGLATKHEDLETPEMFSFFRGEVTEENYWESVIRRNGWETNVGTLQAAVRENFEEMPGTRSIIVRLWSKGYKLGLLSVHAREWVAYLVEKFDYERHFDFCSYSCDNGLLKPEPKAYQVVLHILDSQPRETVFIDDMRRNVEAAKKLGMTGIHFTDAGTLRNDLEKLALL